MCTNLGLLLIATGQNWPNAFSAYLYKDKVDRVWIYATPPLRESAVSLMAYVKAVGHIDVEVKYGKGNSLTEFDAFLDEVRSNGDWIVNATGGLKTFSFRIAGCIAESWIHQLIYREMSDGWYSLVLDGDQVKQIRLSELDQEEAIAMPAVGIEPLFQLQLQSSDIGVSASNRRVTFPPSEALDQFVNEITGSQWMDAFNAIGGEGDSGAPLEWLVFATAQLAGLRTFHSTELKRNRTILAEADVLAFGRSFAVHFDCKLAGVDHINFTTQMLEAKGKTETLLGRGGKTVMVRPTKDVTDEARALAKRMEVDIWARTDMQKFFERMSRYALDDATRVALLQLQGILADQSEPWGAPRPARGPIWDFREPHQMTLDNECVWMKGGIGINDCVYAGGQGWRELTINGANWVALDGNVVEAPPPPEFRAEWRNGNEPSGIALPHKLCLRFPPGRFGQGFRDELTDEWEFFLDNGNLYLSGPLGDDPIAIGLCLIDRIKAS